jgi:hypothetical protein
MHGCFSDKPWLSMIKKGSQKTGVDDGDLFLGSVLTADLVKFYLAQLDLQAMQIWAIFLLSCVSRTIAESCHKFES